MFEPELPKQEHPNMGEPPSASDEGDLRASAATEGLTVDLVKLALRRVKDPEINMNIMDLGLIYDVHVDGDDVRVDMSLTSPGCPSGPEIMGDAQRQIESVAGVKTATINLVWSPPWTPDRIEPRVRAYLGF